MMGRWVSKAVLLLALAIPGAAHADGGVETVPARQVGNGSEWVSDIDYPTAALRNAISGNVGFQLKIGIDGKPSTRKVDRSSGNAELDRTTCELVMKRARFFPATGSDGQPVEGSFRSTIRWRIPGSPGARPDLPATSQFSMTYDVTPNGSVTGCKVAVAGEMASKVSGDPQALCAKIGPYAPPVDATGKPVKKHVIVEDRLVVEDAP